jgi:hypothetical protein
MLSDEDRRNAEIPSDELELIADDEKADRFTTFYFHKSCKILSREHCEWLCAFLDFMWAKTSDLRWLDRDNMLLSVSDKIFQLLLSLADKKVGFDGDATKVWSALREAHEQIPGGTETPMISLRMARGSSNSSRTSTFSCGDGCTTKIALNSQSEYKGGKLCFYLNGDVHVLDQLVGSMVQFPDTVLHGITQLTEGTQKSLWMVDDHTSSVGGSSLMSGHQPVSEQDVETFWMIRGGYEQPSPRAPHCIACTEASANHVLVPCGHFCLCSDCVTRVHHCPCCRTVIAQKQKVFY